MRAAEDARVQAGPADRGAVLVSSSDHTERKSTEVIAGTSKMAFMRYGL